MLNKRHYTTKDVNGCEFGYTVYSEGREYNLDTNKFESNKLYVDDVFNQEYKSINEMKIKMSKK